MFNANEYLPKLRDEFEGAVEYMYLDTGGNVTVGVGNLLVSANHAAQLGFVRRASLGTATAAEIQADFDNITRQLAGKGV